MLDVAKIPVAASPRRTAQDFRNGALLAPCDAYPSIPLVFIYDGRAVHPGDHVTEVKAGRFATIIRKVADHVALDPAARLSFEVSDSLAPMRRHCADIPTPIDGTLRVVLSARSASCKPRDRRLEAKRPKEACCG